MPEHRPAARGGLVGPRRDRRGCQRTQWTHVAATYDGATLRLYVNGVSVSSRAQTGSMAVSASPLRIGGNAVWSEWFAGAIDEVRLYNRALSSAEIQTDMATPIG